VLARVTSKTLPSQDERKRMNQLASQLESEVRSILDGHGYDADVSVQGSVARDTWLRGEADLDIFAAFPQTLERDQWNRRVIPQLKKGLDKHKIIERYAEHPFLEFHVDGIRVNVVPCYKVNRGEWKSATDRTPYHTEYMKAHLSNGMRSDVRLLKKFMKGVGVYGAEIRIGGFSGMLAETLILHYNSFLQTLERAGQWNNHVLIRVEKGAEIEPKARFDTQLVVVDPVDPNRNLAAAVRGEKLWSFVAASREFLGNPSLQYFYPPMPKTHSASEFNRELARSGDTVAVAFPHPPLVVDVLWGQLLSLEKSLVGLLQRFDFRVVKSQAWSDERKLGVVLFELEASQLAKTRIHLGPPVSRGEESESFLKRHSGSSSTVSGPFVRNDRWVVEKKREFPSASGLLRSALKDSHLALSIPKQLHDSVRSKARVIDKQATTRLASNPSFAETLWDFLDGRPRWLRPRRV
jgi:tRNA nucleotidyltransferase (CCA-adding enzyme)